MKPRRKLRLKLYDEARLTEKWGIRFSWTGFVAVSLIIMCACVGIGIGIVWFTPLKVRLPGYMEESQRTASADMLLHLDSLIDINEKNQRFLDNIAAVLEPDKTPADTAKSNYRHGLFTPEELADASEKEIQYVLSIQRRKEDENKKASEAEFGHLNVSNLHPESSSIGLIPMTNKLKVKMPSGESVGSIGDGIVLSINPYNKNSYTVAVYHPGGYQSSVSGVTRLAVKEGEAVKAATELGKSAGEILTVQMWRDGIGVNPEDYINQKK